MLRGWKIAGLGFREACFRCFGSWCLHRSLGEIMLKTLGGPAFWLGKPRIVVFFKLWFGNNFKFSCFIWVNKKFFFGVHKMHSSGCCQPQLKCRRRYGLLSRGWLGLLCNAFFLPHPGFSISIASLSTLRYYFLLKLLSEITHLFLGFLESLKGPAAGVEVFCNSCCLLKRCLMVSCGEEQAGYGAEDLKRAAAASPGLLKRTAGSWRRTKKQI